MHRTNIEEYVFRQDKGNSRDAPDLISLPMLLRKKKGMNDHRVSPYCVQIYYQEAWCVGWSEACCSVMAFLQHVMTYYGVLAGVRPVVV